MYMNGENIVIGMRVGAIKGLENGKYRYAYYGKFGSLKTIDEATRMAVIYSSNKPITKTRYIESKVFFAVGSLQEVVNSLANLPMKY